MDCTNIPPGSTARISKYADFEWQIFSVSIRCTRGVQNYRYRSVVSKSAYFEILAVDPGGMFVQSMKLIKAYSGRNDNVFIFGQKSNPDTWKIAKINMAIRGNEANLGVYPKDTFVIDLQA